MERRNFFRRTGVIALSASGSTLLAGCSGNTGLKPGEILHTVIFDLKHPAGSSEAEKFIADGQNILSKIPGVHDFQAFRQCSPKNDYRYGFYMRFENQGAFDAYTVHPDHCRFVSERWDTEVIRFQESDFQKL